MDDEDLKIREAVYLILNKLDQDRSGSLSFEEFKQWHQITRASEEDVADLFANIDEDNDGFINAEELCKFFKKIVVRDTNPAPKPQFVMMTKKILTR